LASIQPRLRADGSTAYAVLWREGGHREARQRSKTFDDPNKARQLQEFLDANGQTYELALDAMDAALGEGITIAEAGRRWIENNTGIQDHTREEYERNLRLHIKPTLGARRAADLTKDDIRAWVRHLQAQGSQPSTIRLYHATLHGIMTWAIEQKIRDDNPCKGIKLPRVDKSRIRGKKIEHDDYLSIVLPEVPEKYRPVVEVIAGTGCRVSEALALDVGDFHPGDRKKGRPGRLIFTKTWKRSKNVGILKTDDSLRTLDIAWDLNDLLVKLTEGRHHDEYLFVDPDAVPDPDEKKRDPKGCCIKYFTFEAAWTAATERMLDPKREGGHLRKKPTIYWLRHSHGAWLLEKGIDIVTVSRRLGHASIKTTGDIYGHSTDASLRAVVTALDGLGK
jgi:site-specific recombinase XerD